MELTTCKPLPKAKYQLDPKFGTVFAPHMLRMEIGHDSGSYKGEIVPFAKEMFSPATVVFHYGQAIFEGMKAFVQKDNSVAVFRADLHAKRFALSSQKMSMPVIPEKIFLECIQKYVAFEKESVPHEADHALYLRPLMIGRDEILKVGQSKNYSFYILGCIVGNYFPGGAVRAAKVLVNRQFVRAFPGGLGEAKTAANYAMSLTPQTYADKHGYNQVLYLDAIEHEWIDELGGMNFFVVKKSGELVTPVLNGCILNGVTRRSILEYAPSLGIKTKEEKLSWTAVKKGIQSGEITEAFACGTAAVVQPIGELAFQENTTSPLEKLTLPATFPTSLKLLEAVKGLQRGNIKAPGDWLFRCYPS
jgi:branched-chain amino acid aminotransferase